MSATEMTPKELADILSRTLDDGHLSRTERRALVERLKEQDPDARERALYRYEAFTLARARMHDPRDAALLDWLVEVVKLFDPQDAVAPLAEAHFSPRQDCAQRVVHLLEEAQRTVDICVYTITDDRIANAISAAHARGVQIRIITDEAKEHDLGSDIDRLRYEGVPVREDDSEHHMHHKFAIFDGHRLVTGSFNWTRAAARYNQENLVVTSDRHLLRAFEHTFERLWERYA